MDMYACDICGYYYAPEYGDEENLIAPDTPFAKLPSDWACPGCDASKDAFCRVGQPALGAYDEYDLAYTGYID